MRVQALSLSVAALAANIVLADTPQTPKTGASASSFESTVQPILSKSCSACHNDSVASGGLNLHLFNTAGSITAHREEWERIVQKIRSGEMPPKGMPRPPAAQVEALTKFVQDRWAEADKSIAPDPGRVTARRLNRVEYSNTIRDLL